MNGLKTAAVMHQFIPREAFSDEALDFTGSKVVVSTPGERVGFFMKDEIEKIITEELGINEDVKQVTTRIESDVKTSAYNEIKKIGGSISDYYHITNNIQERIGKYDFTVTYTCFIFHSPGEYWNTNSSIPSPQYDPKKNIIYINASYVIGKKVTVDTQSLQDEVHHMFQRNNVLMTEFDSIDEKYITAIKVLENPNALPEYKIVARVVYMMSKPEISAITNNFYRIAMSSDDDVNDVLNSQHFKNIKAIDEKIESLLQNDIISQKLEKALAYFGFNKKSFLRKIKELKRIYLRNAGRAIVKSRTDKEETIVEPNETSLENAINELEKLL